MRDGEGEVIADVLTTRLLSVADKVGLLIAPNLEEDYRKQMVVEMIHDLLKFCKFRM